MSRGAYLASEDSALMRKALAGYAGDSCLEIGAGNGGNLVELEEKFGIVVGTDIVRPDADDWKRRADFVLADAAGCFREGIFDLVFFNPPYLPSEGVQDAAVDGGREGLDVPLRFLGEAIRALKVGGRVLVLVVGEKQAGAMIREFDSKGFASRKVVEKQLFYETLLVYEGSGRPASLTLGLR